MDTLLYEVLRDTHRYVPGTGQRRAANVKSDGGDRIPALLREGGRDALERTAARLGFTHRHYRPELAAERLKRIVELAAGLEATWQSLGDESSRRALIDVLKLRVLGPHHAPLAITPQAYRQKQDYAERHLRLQEATFAVSDPWLSPLSLYRVAAAEGHEIALHSHSVEIVSVFLLQQYAYARGSRPVEAGPGDVVLDVGGCWGGTALYFASLVGSTGKVYTFEFDPESLEVLRANLALNPALKPRVEVVELALWESSGRRLPFVQAGASTTVLPGHEAADRPEVETLTIDDFVQQTGIDGLGFVKLDVEGAELPVLRGAGRALEQFRPRLAIAAYHRDDDLARIPAALGSPHTAYQLFLESFSPLEDETVLFATP